VIVWIALDRLGKLRGGRVVSSGGERVIPCGFMRRRLLLHRGRHLRASHRTRHTSSVSPSSSHTRSPHSRHPTHPRPRLRALRPARAPRPSPIRAPFSIPIPSPSPRPPLPTTPTARDRYRASRITPRHPASRHRLLVPSSRIFPNHDHRHPSRDEMR